MTNFDQVTIFACADKTNYSEIEEHRAMFCLLPLIIEQLDMHPPKLMVPIQLVERAMGHAPHQLEFHTRAIDFQI